MDRPMSDKDRPRHDKDIEATYTKELSKTDYLFLIVGIGMPLNLVILTKRLYINVELAPYQCLVNTISDYLV